MIHFSRDVVQSGTRSIRGNAIRLENVETGRPGWTDGFEPHLGRRSTVGHQVGGLASLAARAILAVDQPGRLRGQRLERHFISTIGRPADGGPQTLRRYYIYITLHCVCVEMQLQST